MNDNQRQANALTGSHPEPNRQVLQPASYVQADGQPHKTSGTARVRIYTHSHPSWPTAGDPSPTKHWLGLHLCLHCGSSLQIPAARLCVLTRTHKCTHTHAHAVQTNTCARAHTYTCTRTCTALSLIPLTLQQLCIVDTLGAADDLLAADEDVKGVGVLRVVSAGHGVEGPHAQWVPAW